MSPTRTGQGLLAMLLYFFAVIIIEVPAGGVDATFFGD